MEVISPESTPQETRGQVPVYFTRLLARNGIRPALIETRSQDLAGLLRDAMDLLDVPIQVVRRLRELDEALKCLSKFT
jgi:hypothetical protein